MTYILKQFCFYNGSEKSKLSYSYGSYQENSSVALPWLVSLKCSVTDMILDLAEIDHFTPVTNTICLFPTKI